MNAALAPSGARTSLRSCRAAPPVRSGCTAQRAAPGSHTYVAESTATRIPPGTTSKLVNGRANGLTSLPVAWESPRARASWSKARARVFFAGSTTTNSVPSAKVFRYQKRSPSSQVGRTAPPRTSGFMLAPRNRSALA